VRIRTPRLKNELVTKCHKGPRTWKNILDRRGSGNEIRCLEHKYQKSECCSFPDDSFEKLSKYKLDQVGIQEVRWEGGGTEPAGEYTFVYGKGNENHELGTGCLRA
jgi:hypothetical protein